MGMTDGGTVQDMTLLSSKWSTVRRVRRVFFVVPRRRGSSLMARLHRCRLSASRASQLRAGRSYPVYPQPLTVTATRLVPGRDGGPPGQGRDGRRTGGTPDAD